MRFLRLLSVFLFVISCKHQEKTSDPKLTKISGNVFGTSYSVLYDADRNYELQMDSIFYKLNKSLSTYQANSDISKINRNTTVQVDIHFKAVFEASMNVYELTDGAFDPTIGSVVNAWDFGPEGKINEIDSLKIDSLMLSVGMDKVKIRDDRVFKLEGTYLDFNAIAKGFAVDVIASFFEAKGITNYLVEIGGEIRVKGRNTEKNSAWTAGIEAPNFDGQRSILKAIDLYDESMATSGTYRKFKVDANGKRYSHIIDTSTGYPSMSNILSVSILTSSCMYADAYATAFKLMGIAKIKTFLEGHKEVKAFIIYEDERGELATLALNGFPE